MANKTIKRARDNETKTEEGTADSDTQYQYQYQPDQNAAMPWGLECLAVFGYSSVALASSFALLLIAVGTAWYLDPAPHYYYEPTDASLADNTAASWEAAYQQLGTIPPMDPPTVFDLTETATATAGADQESQILPDELKQSFAREGVLAIRGLLDANLLQRLDQASAQLVDAASQKKQRKPKGALTGQNAKRPTPSGTQFFTVTEGAIFLGLDHLDEEASSSNHETSSTTTSGLPDALPPFLELALHSKIAQVSAELLGLGMEETYSSTEPTRTLRLMRDIFLAKDTDAYICGWHVDDTGFWPATADAPGVNAWIALDDMPAQGGGGFALAVGSHVASWRDQAYHVTGSTHTFPPEGFQSAQDIVQRRVGNGTCNIETAAPHLHRRMEDTKRVYDLQRGDVIFHSRWLFHRTVPFDSHRVEEVEGQDGLVRNSSSPLLYRRYSVRYGPGSSEIPRGYGTEPSVLWEAENGGRTADEVAANDIAWYPQAWPRMTAEETAEQFQHLKVIATERLPLMTKRADARKKQMRSVRTASARQHIYRQPH